MFLKPLKIKSQQQLKTTDKKRLIEELSKTFLVLTVEYIENLVSKKEDILLLKIETRSNLLIPVYVVKDQPLFFIYNQTLFPTLHILWKCPNMILVFKTHLETLKKLVSGADLMLPGVVEPSIRNMPVFLKDTPACISSNKLKMPVIVGVTAASSNDMKGLVKGKCLHTLHVIGDKLFNLRNRMSSIPSPFEELLILVKSCDIEDEKIDFQPKDNVVTNHIQDEKQIEPHIEAKNDQYDSETTIDNDCVTNSVKEMDDLIMHSLLVAIKYSKGLHCPILTSNFFKTYLVPACPQNKTLDIKKSSFKRCGLFMKQMMELGILKVEEQKKGIEFIIEFNYEHPFITEFYLDPSERPKNAKDLEDYVKPVISEAHSVTAAVLPIFAEFNFKKGSVIGNAEIRMLVSQYVKLRDLQDKSSKNFVNLNDDLRFALKVPRCTFEEVIKNVYALMSPCYKIVCGNSEIIHKGKLEPINISVVKRSGNKKVTFVDNVETYGININELGNMCQHGVAASTTIICSENPKKGNQLLIQGNQVLFVYNLLTEKCKIPKWYVKGLEFAPKK